MSGRPIVIDMEALNAPRPQRRREWWQACTVEEFREELDRMLLPELESLISEINAAVASTGTLVSNGTKDEAWKTRARRALPSLTQRRSILAAEIRRRQNDVYKSQGQERKRIVADVRALAMDGDLRGALLRLLDWVEGFGQHRKREGAESAMSSDSGGQG